MLSPGFSGVLSCRVPAKFLPGRLGEITDTVEIEAPAIGLVRRLLQRCPVHGDVAGARATRCAVDCYDEIRRGAQPQVSDATGSWKRSLLSDAKTQAGGWALPLFVIVRRSSIVPKRTGVSARGEISHLIGRGATRRTGIQQRDTVKGITLDRRRKVLWSGRTQSLPGASRRAIGINKDEISGVVVGVNYSGSNRAGLQGTHCSLSTAIVPVEGIVDIEQVSALGYPVPSLKSGFVSAVEPTASRRETLV